MSPISRGRGVAVALCLAALLGLAGCAGTFASDSEPSPVALEQIRIENGDAAAHEVGVLITENGSVVAWRSFELGARSDGSEIDAETLRPPRFDGGPGGYTVYVRVGDATNRTVDVTDGRVGSLASDCTSQGGRVRLELTVTDADETDLWFGCE